MSSVGVCYVKLNVKKSTLFTVEIWFQTFTIKGHERHITIKYFKPSSNSFILLQEIQKLVIESIFVPNITNVMQCTFNISAKLTILSVIFDGKNDKSYCTLIKICTNDWIPFGNSRKSSMFSFLAPGPSPVVIYFTKMKLLLWNWVIRKHHYDVICKMVTKIWH